LVVPWCVDKLPDCELKPVEEVDGAKRDVGLVSPAWLPVDIAARLDVEFCLDEESERDWR
jgi:hypothetical protein